MVCWTFCMFGRQRKQGRSRWFEQTVAGPFATSQRVYFQKSEFWKGQQAGRASLVPQISVTPCECSMTTGPLSHKSSLRATRGKSRGEVNILLDAVVSFLLLQGSSDWNPVTGCSKHADITQWLQQQQQQVFITAHTTGSFWKLWVMQTLAPLLSEVKYTAPSIHFHKAGTLEARRQILQHSVRLVVRPNEGWAGP